MNAKYLENYAELVVKFGVNIQKGQLLVINSPIECADFARLIASKAYENGAKDVYANWKDELFGKMRLEKAPEEALEECPDWQKAFYMENAERGAAFVSIAASDPELLKDVDPMRIVKSQKTINRALTSYRERIMKNENAWCVVSVPTVAWAQKVFPNCTEVEAVEKLWDAIFITVKADREDVLQAWQEHKQSFSKRLKLLNEYKFNKLHYKNSLGTDLTIGLPPEHIWLAAAEKTTSGVDFIANIPTEELFTLPDKVQVDGTVYSSKPLNYNGNIIDGFKLVFKAGKVVEYDAKCGKEVLKHLLETDDGAAYLGEVALVPHDSPISNTNILFYNTLFDENASCHLAFGKAYPSCLQGGGQDKTKEELSAMGVNDSLIHVDFMIGTHDLKIVGECADGSTVVVFQDGNFTF